MRVRARCRSEVQHEAAKTGVGGSQPPNTEWNGERLGEVGPTRTVALPMSRVRRPPTASSSLRNIRPSCRRSLKHPHRARIVTHGGNPANRDD